MALIKFVIIHHLIFFFSVEIKIINVSGMRRDKGRPKRP